MGKRSVASVDETNWDIILKALQNNQVLEFDYENVRTSKKGYSRKIEPWQLIYDSEQWYLRGYAEDQNNPDVKNIRNFVVPRMKNLKLLPQHFKLPEEKIWRLDEYNVGSFGALASDKIEEYQFIFQDRKSRPEAGLVVCMLPRHLLAFCKIAFNKFVVFLIPKVKKKFSLIPFSCA